MANKQTILKAKQIKPTPQNALFEGMDVNAERYFRGQTFWRELHAIDQELEKGSVFVEDFRDAPAITLAGNSSSDEFFIGEKTVVIKLKNNETATQGARLLNQLFKGTGTRFVAETMEGQPQIRSNIDKIQHGKLSAISKFYFQKDIQDEKERERYHQECQSVVDRCVKDTDAMGEWKANEGVLSFVSLMGLHGNLRPKERRPCNIARKQEELNKRHIRGDSKLFEGIVIHVDVDKTGKIYGILYSPAREAYHLASGEGVFHILFEVFGGDVTSESVPAVKGLRTASLSYGLYALLIHEDWFPPAIFGSVAGISFGVDFLRHLQSASSRLERNRELLEKQYADDPLPPPLRSKEPEPWKAPEFNDSLHHAYTRRDMETVATQSSDYLNDQHVAYIRKALDNAAHGNYAEKLHAEIAGHQRRNSHDGRS